MAAASATQNLDAPVASEVLVELLAAADPGVRKVARAAVPSRPTAALARRLEEAPEASGQMPGESQGRMPGER